MVRQRTYDTNAGAPTSRVLRLAQRLGKASFTREDRDERLPYTRSIHRGSRNKRRNLHVLAVCSAALVHRRKTRPLRRRYGYLVPEAGMFCTCCSNLILARYLERPLQENLVEWSRGQRINC